MSSSNESVLGHQEKYLDPEKQLDILRRGIKGEERLPYRNFETAIWATRMAIQNAVNILEDGRRKYSDEQLKGMNIQLDVLKRVVEEGKIGCTKKDSEGDHAPEEDAAEIREIKALIDNAVALYGDKSKFEEACAKFEEAIQKIEEARLKDIDVIVLEKEIRNLGTFFSE